MILTKHFNLNEFLTSSTMPGFADKIHVPEEVIHNLFLLCALGLEPIRERFGPVIITSGYRSPALNEKVGGAENSRHLYGMAADYRVPDTVNGEVYEFLKFRGWLGESIWYPKEKRYHISLPKLGCESVIMVKT